MYYVVIEDDQGRERGRLGPFSRAEAMEYKECLRAHHGWRVVVTERVTLCPDPFRF